MTCQLRCSVWFRDPGDEPNSPREFGDMGQWGVSNQVLHESEPETTMFQQNQAHWSR
jgi:hypothetical protein